MHVTFKVSRFNPQTDQQPYFDTFTIEVQPNERLLDCLNRIRWTLDSSLSFRMSCAHGICGSDGLTINGVEALACQKLVRDYDYTKEIVVEPLRYFTVVKDLIVELKPFFNRIKSINPQNPPNALDIPPKERLQTVEERNRYNDAIKCILCACCYSSCPVQNNEDIEFVGPAAILREQRYIFDSRTSDAAERLSILQKPHGTFSCKGYYRCTRVCPKGIEITEAIFKTKKKILSDKQSIDQ